ncbi:MAG: hypothetical protein GAK38_03711 [Xylophilus sp.]|nr:MAG: hypothetical protein GAK38_03711 [Xylophilus sp.]
MNRAVMAGMGLALVPRCLVADEIANGLVAEPLPGYRSTLGCWFCHPEGRAPVPALGCFRDWLLAQAEQDILAPQ